MRQSVGLLIALLLGMFPIQAAARSPRSADFLEYLQESDLSHLYATELRNLCLDGNDLTACNDYLALLKHGGRAEEAVTFTDSIGSRRAHADLAVRLIKARALADASKYSEAVSVLDDIIASLPPREALVEAAFLRARCWYELGNIDAALVNLRAVEPYATDAQAAEFAVLLARCEEAGGDLARAETIYREVLEQEESGVAALGVLRCRLKQGDVAGFFDLWTGLQRRRVMLPAGETSRLAIAIGELVPEAWHALMGAVIADPGLANVADSAVVSSVVQLAESGEPVDRYCDSLLTLDLPRGLKDEIRYGWALSEVESTWAADTLRAVAARAESRDLRLRSALGAVAYASDEARPAIAAELMPDVTPFAQSLAADERFELASMLIDSELTDDGTSLAYEVLGDVSRATDAARVAIASLLERSGATDMARDIYEAAGASIVPTEHSLEARKRAYLLTHRTDTSAEGTGVAAEVERIAREGASDLELGDLLTRLGDFKRASDHYRRAIDTPPEGTDPDETKFKLIQSLCREWIETGDEELRREALGLVDEIADSPAVSPALVRAALDLSTDWLRVDHDRAFGIAQTVGGRDDLTSNDLYENARILYSLFLKRDGNVYTECVLTLRRLLEEFPDSDEAPAARLLLGRAKFMAGDYVGALEEYGSCVAGRSDDEVTRLCRTGIGECYLYSGGITEALAHFKVAVGTPRALYNTARCFELVEEADSAEVYYRKALSGFSDSGLADAVRLRLSLLALGQEGLEAAMRETDSPVPAVRERLGDVRRIVRAYGLGRAGYRDMAVAELERLSGKEWRFACDALLLAASLQGAADPAEAGSLLEPGRERCADIFGVLSLLEARAAYACSEDLDECAEARKAFRKRFPLAEGKHLGVDLRALLLLFREGKADSASAVLESLRDRGGGQDLMARAIYRQGVELMIGGDYPGAVAAFAAVERDYPDHPLYRDACFKLGTAYYMAGEYDSSAYYFDLASDSDKASLVENAFFNLGLALEKIGDLTASARAFWSLATEFPLSDRFERSLMRAAYALERAGDPHEAVRIYRGLLNYAEDHETAAEAVYWTGESYSEMGDHLRAAVEFLRVGYAYPDEEAWAGTACFRAGNECEAAGLTDHAVAIYKQNVRRFGRGSDWGKASADRLAELLREGGPEEPPAPSDEPPSSGEEDR